jgi:acetoacetyl-[acyl-carrier protein] synthase
MGALASDDDLKKLDGSDVVDHRRASRPFAENCGFTIAESAQYMVLMAPDLALELGAKIYGAVSAVYVNADGYKKSISSPGAGNYLTMAKALGHIRSVLGDDALRKHSFVQAHGSSTPQNRVTESHILDSMAQAFGINNWPLAAVKSYLGHTIGAASGDQMAACLGSFERGLVPGIQTIDAVASDVYGSRLAISSEHQQLDDIKVGFLNSKGFGGNNATAAVLAPSVVDGYLSHHYSASALADYRAKLNETEQHVSSYISKADSGELDVEYHFGADMIDESQIAILPDSLTLPGHKQTVKLDNDEGYVGFK